MKKLTLVLVFLCSQVIFAGTVSFSKCTLSSFSDENKKEFFPKTLEVLISNEGLLSVKDDNDVDSPLSYLSEENVVHDGVIASTPELPLYEVSLWGGPCTAYYISITTLIHNYLIIHIDDDYYHLQGKYDCVGSSPIKATK